MLWLIGGAAVVVIVLVVWVRPWLRTKPWAQGFMAWIEPIEIMLWRKSETILFARFKMIVGVLLTVLTQAGSIDITPLMPFVPDKYEGILRLAFNMLPMTLTLLGALDEQLRKDTTKPLEIVALPQIKPPEVAAAVAEAEATKVAAVAVIAKDAAVTAASQPPQPSGAG